MTPKLLADLTESFLAALLLDKGLQYASKFFEVCIFSKLAVRSFVTMVIVMLETQYRRPSREANGWIIKLNYNLLLSTLVNSPATK